MNIDAAYTYLLVNLGALIIPLLFSFHPKLRFYKLWKEALLSIFFVSIPFIVWDIIFTSMGVWGFNQKYLTGISIFNLPIEEVLFFYCIPYACLFTYHCFKLIKKKVKFFPIKWINYTLIGALLLTALIYYHNWYTLVTFSLLSFLLIIIQWKFDFEWLPRLYLTLLVLIIPFLIVNGILTGTGIDMPVVWYSPNEFIGIRVLSIPFEDFFYGFLLILLNAIFLEYFSSNKYFSDKSV